MSNTDPPASPEVALQEARARAEELERRLVAIQKETEQRLIRAELKAEAMRAGMVHLDGLKLLDLSATKLSATGDVEGAAELMAQAKREKPWLFAGTSSSAAVTPPPVAMPTKKKAMDMTESEYRAARAELLKHRV